MGTEGAGSVVSGEFRSVKVELADVHIDMLSRMAEIRGAISRSELIRWMILDAFRVHGRSIHMNSRSEAMSVPVKTQSGEFLAILDTGSYHSLIPEKYAAGFVFTGITTIWTFNTIMRQKLYRGELEVLGKKIPIEDVLLASGEIGILGLDVMEHLEVYIKGGKAEVKLI